jgi:hypothetical protein
MERRIPDRVGCPGRAFWQNQARSQAPAACWGAQSPPWAAHINVSRERKHRLMDWQNSTNGLKPTQGSIVGKHIASSTALAELPAADAESVELTDLDDNVEALIIHMDRTTAEHLFLRAQRRDFAR